MKFQLIRRTGAALALTMTVSALALAQRGGTGSDGSGPGGGGGGVGGSLGLGVHPPRAGAGAPSAANVSAGLVNIAGGLTSTGRGGSPAPNPITGTTASVPQAVAVGLGQVLSGNTAGSAALTTGLTAGGTLSGGAANALVQALLQLGGSPTFGHLQAAVIAYNNAVAALGPGPVPPALLAVRAALGNVVH